MPSGLAWITLGTIERGIMTENLDLLNVAVSLLIRAALLAARCSGRVRQRSLKRLAAMNTDAKAKEILFLKDRVYQLEMQVSILQKHLHKKGQSSRYAVHERLLILWHIEAFQIPRRKVSRYFGIARSTLYRWLHQIEKEESPAPVVPASHCQLYESRTLGHGSVVPGGHRQFCESPAMAPSPRVAMTPTHPRPRRPGHPPSVV
jgi:hypothetical protein